MNKQATSKTFGKIVKVKLIELNMTQVELVELLGIKRQYLCRILNGDRSGKKYLSDIRQILEIEAGDTKEKVY
ncbi:MAG: helix-turn-helix domain-containing protein [Lachnotalea sp.]